MLREIETHHGSVRLKYLLAKQILPGDPFDQGKQPFQDLVLLFSLRDAAAHQQITREWWETRRHNFTLYTSQLVLQEAAGGDKEMAEARLNVLTDLPALGVTDEASTLAKALIGAGTPPKTAPEDALHIAIAVVNGLEYLLTWNCRHIANATMRRNIEHVCRAQGFEPTILCTPEELLDE